MFHILIGWIHRFFFFSLLCPCKLCIDLSLLSNPRSSTAISALSFCISQSAICILTVLHHFAMSIPMSSSLVSLFPLSSFSLVPD